MISCGNSTGPSSNATISGRVVSEDGTPIPNAKIVTTYYIEPIESYRPVTNFNFSLADNENVKLWLTNYDETDTLVVIAESNYSAGHHSVTWSGIDKNGLYLVSNLYQYHLRIGDYLLSRDLLYNMYYGNFTGESVDSINCFATTDDQGYFSFNMSQIPLFKDFHTYGWDESGYESEYEFSDFIQLWATHNEYYPNSIEELQLYKNQDCKDVEIVLHPFADKEQ